MRLQKKQLDAVIAAMDAVQGRFPDGFRDEGLLHGLMEPVAFLLERKRANADIFDSHLQVAHRAVVCFLPVQWTVLQTPVVQNIPDRIAQIKIIRQTFRVIGVGERGIPCKSIMIKGLLNYDQTGRIMTVKFYIE